MTSGSSCRGIVVGGMGEVAVFPKPFYRQFLQHKWNLAYRRANRRETRLKFVYIFI